MLELLTTYSIAEILMFVVMLAIAIKEVVTFIEWAVTKLRQLFKKGFNEDKERENVYAKIKKEDKWYPENFDKIGLDYVSCSAFRVPGARLASAQSNIKNSK